MELNKSGVLTYLGMMGLVYIEPKV